MMRNVFTVWCIALCVGCTASYADDSPLQKTNSFFKQLGSLSSKSSSSAAPMPKPTAAQENTLKEQLANTLDDDKINASRVAAAPTIEDVLSILACSTDLSPLSRYQQYIAPNYYSGAFFSPHRSLRYHPKNQCLTVSHMDGWVMPALNVIEFRVVFVSDSSGESAVVSYQLMHQADGRWLFTGNRGS